MASTRSTMEATELRNEHQDAIRKKQQLEREVRLRVRKTWWCQNSTKEGWLTHPIETTHMQLRVLQVARSEVDCLKPGKAVYEKRCAVFFLADRNEVRENVQGKLPTEDANPTTVGKADEMASADACLAEPAQIDEKRGELNSFQ